jgi:TIR domain
MIFERGHFDKQKLTESIVKKALDDSRNLKFKTAVSFKPTVFLSHKHDDLNDLQGVMGLLEDLGAEIYIDSMDNKMPNQTNGETATRIKEIIKQSDKFILLATDKAIESYWCNWELGIGDVYKYIKHIAVLPMKEKKSWDHNYKGNEYLQIYPSIDYEDGTRRYRTSRKIVPKGFYVSNSLNSKGIRYITPLKDWLKE